MERLTKKDPFNKGYYGISSELICNVKENGDWFDDGLFYTGTAVKKLAEYENFMEENGFESLEELKEANDNYRSTAYQYEDDNAVVNELLELLDLSSIENLIIDKIKQLKHDLAVRDRALDLACKKIEELRAEIYEYNEIKTEICKKLLFDQAEKELKGEK